MWDGRENGVRGVDMLVESWPQWAAIGAGAVVLVTLCYLGISTLRHRSESRRRITAARVRSGMVPLEIPTIRGGSEDAPDTIPFWARSHDNQMIVVDEQPRMFIRYVSVQGKLVEKIVHVEHLDLQRRMIVARGDIDTETRLYPLERIRQARNVQSGKPFNLDTWVDAVRAARRRRDNFQATGYDEPQLV